MIIKKSHFKQTYLIGNSPVIFNKRSLPLTWFELTIYCLLLFIGVILRLWDLDSRAMHHDESLHAMYSYYLSTGEGYEHNPMMHGPLQFILNAAIFIMFGDSDYSARLLYAVMGSLLIILPIFIRNRLGKTGAILVSLGIMISPSLLYFSRFARNDILVAVWTFGLVVCMWKYFDDGRNRYLYISSALLALLFASKETAYIVTAVFGSYLIFSILSARMSYKSHQCGTDKSSSNNKNLNPAETNENCQPQSLSSRTGSTTYQLQGLSPPQAIALVIRTISTALFKVDFRFPNRQVSFFTVLGTLSLVQWSASVGYFQNTALLNWSNLILAQPIESNQIGSPEGGGQVIAFLIVCGLLALSIYWGAKWNWSNWWRCAAIYWVIWVILFSTFFTNPHGIGSGIWQSLGYWIAQQEVARGNQPWYYYFMLTSIYEALPLVFCIFAYFFYRKRADKFAHFLIFWTVMNFALYTYSSEKMPWLLVNTTLPIIILAGKFIGELSNNTPWPIAKSWQSLLLVIGLPLFLLLSWNIFLLDFQPKGLAETSSMIFMFGATIVCVLLAINSAKYLGKNNFLKILSLSLAILLTIITFRTSLIASFKNDDVPVELLVYTQTSPDVLSILDQIEEIDDSSGQWVTVDQTSGFTWPWAWYLRNRTKVEFPNYDVDPVNSVPNSSVVIVHLNNKSSTDKALADSFTKGHRFKHRWWFPEYRYRDITLGNFSPTIFNRSTWIHIADYYFHRSGVEQDLGSEDAVVYFARSQR